MPMVRSVAGIRPASACGSVSMTKEAKYRPAESLTTVTEVGVAGSVRDHFTFTAPILGRFSRPLSVRDQRALAVNRIDWRVSLRDLNRGAPSFGPLRVPLREAKKLRCAVFGQRGALAGVRVQPEGVPELHDGDATYLGYE